MFIDPINLPPKRAHDHKIPLTEVNTLINLRPYRCAHFQKNIIEKLVQEMMLLRVIRLSINSCASPVVLVKKKDGSW